VGTSALPLKPEFGSNEGGEGGAVQLEAVSDGGQVIVRHGGQVAARTLGSGKGGNITISAGDLIRVDTDSQVVARTGAEGDGGSIVLEARRIEIADGAEISAKSAAFRDEGGNVDLSELGETIDGIRDLLRDPPATAAGNAGSITLHASQLVHLDAGDITTSVGGETGGNITIDPVFVILENHSNILATADTGHGGVIRITAENFFAFPGSVVSADSKDQRLSGTVEVHSPDVDLAGALTPLPSAFLDATSLMRERCAARRSGERAGSFSVRGPGGIPSEPDGWLRAPVLPAAEAALTAAPPVSPTLLASLAVSRLADGACP
jgi:hypothetical protein